MDTQPIFDPDLLDKVKEKVNPYYPEKALDLASLCTDLNIDYYEAEFFDSRISGCLKLSENKYSIYVNSTHAPNRKRFTTAHELGHYFSSKFDSLTKEYLVQNDNVVEDYDKIEKVVWRSDDSQIDANKQLHKNMEVQANWLAAEILMPEEYVKKLVENGLGVDDIAHRLGVSLLSMNYRLINLGYSVPEEYYENKTIDNLQKHL
jgi:Zn-dependent peptidase ImmA (M78 family)